MATPPTRERDVDNSGGGGFDTLNRDAGGFSPSDRERLAAFVRSLHTLLVDMLERPAFFAPHNQRLRAAWVTIDPIFEAFAETIERTGADDTAYPRYGLTGAELEAKLAVFEDARNAYYEEVSRLTDRLPWRLLPIAPAIPLPPPPPVDQPPETTETPAPLPIVRDKPSSGFLRKLSGKARVKGKTAMEVGDKIFKSVVVAVSLAHPPLAVAATAAGDSAEEVKGLMEAVITRVGGLVKKKKKKKNRREEVPPSEPPPAPGTETSR